MAGAVRRRRRLRHALRARRGRARRGRRGARLGGPRVRARASSSARCRRPASGCRRDWALQDPEDYVDVLRDGGARGRRRGGRRRPSDGRRDRDRLHRLDPAAGARRRHAAVRASTSFARPPARLPEAVEAPRRPGAGRPHQRRSPPSAASRGWRATAGGSPRSGSSPRRCRCSRRTPRSTSAMDRWIEARRLDRLAALRATRRATRAPRATRASARTARYPSARLPRGARRALRRLRRGQARAARSRALGARAGGLTRAGGARGPGCPRASPSRSATSTRTSPRPPRRRSSRARCSRSWAPRRAT